MLRTFYRRSTGSVTTDLPATAWRTALHDQTGLLWVDVHAEPLATIEPLLRDTFGFHVLAIDDALREVHVPQLDDWGHYLYAVVHGVVFDPQSRALTTRELDIFLGRHYLVTHHQAVDAVERVWRHIGAERCLLEHGPDYLLYLLLDTLTADYLPAIDALDDTLDALETAVFCRRAPHTLSMLFAVKRAALHLRRIIRPMMQRVLTQTDHPRFRQGSVHVWASSPDGAG
jgi:magnesium transporter